MVFKFPYTFKKVNLKGFLRLIWLSYGEPRFNKQLLGFLLFGLISIGNIDAQITLYTDDFSANKGQIIDVPINIIGFKDIFSMQFSLNWDTTVLQFKEVHSYAESLPQFGAEGVGINGADSGNLIVVWFDNSLKGISIDDSTSLLLVKFEVIGQEGDKSSVTFSDTPALIEIVDASSTVIEPSLVNGEVLISSEMTTSTTVLQPPNGMRLFQNHPNPFDKHTTIQAFFNKPEWVIFTITDTQGKSIYKERFQSRVGANNLQISKEILPTAGTYNYTIQSEAYQLSKLMILLP